MPQKPQKLESRGREHPRAMALSSQALGSCFQIIYTGLYDPAMFLSSALLILTAVVEPAPPSVQTMVEGVRIRISLPEAS